VGVDGSEVSARAVEMALMIADAVRRWRAKLTEQAPPGSG